MTVTKPPVFSFPLGGRGGRRPARLSVPWSARQITPAITHRHRSVAVGVRSALLRIILSPPHAYTQLARSRLFSAHCACSLAGVQSHGGRMPPVCRGVQPQQPMLPSEVLKDDKQIRRRPLRLRAVVGLCLLGTSILALSVVADWRHGDGADTASFRRRFIPSLFRSGLRPLPPPPPAALGVNGMSQPDPATAAGAALGWRPRTAAYDIPRTLHQSWSSSSIPRSLEKFVSTWRTLQPDWSYILHTDADNMALVSQSYAWFEPTFRRLTFIQQADVARLLYMHHHGGVCTSAALDPTRPSEIFRSPPRSTAPLRVPRGSSAVAADADLDCP